LKAATTLDGKIAAHTGHSQRITSSDARTDVHHLRSENEAILVGVNTIIKDDSELTARIPGGRNPIRIIMDTRLRIPLDAKVVVDGKAPTWIFTGRDVDEKKVDQLIGAGVKVF